MKLIDKDALVAEIEKCYNECLKRTKIIDADYWNANADAYRKVLDILNNNIEVKEVDLEKYYYDFLQKEWFGRNCVRTISEMMAFTAKHFFELGLSSQLSWQDVKRLAEIGETFMNSEESDNLSEEEYYTEILNKFKAKEGEQL